FFKVTLITPEGERTITVGSEEHIWDAANAVGIKLPALCHQGRCLTCAGRLEDGARWTSLTPSVIFQRTASLVLSCYAPRSRGRTCESAPTSRRKCGNSGAGKIFPRLTHEWSPIKQGEFAFHRRNDAGSAELSLCEFAFSLHRRGPRHGSDRILRAPLSGGDYLFEPG